MIYDELKESINEAEYVLIGIGDLCGYDWNLVKNDARLHEIEEQIGTDESLYWLFPFFQKVSMDKNPDRKLLESLRKIAEIIKDKDYYVITSTIDDYVYTCGFDNSRVVTPCGGFRKLQCEKGCCNDFTNLPLALLQYVQKLYNKEMNLDEIRDKYPECPFCGANLVFNQIGAETYLEEGYMPNWIEYRTWLEKTMNRKTVLLELGAGLGFMSIIRAPFERYVSYNRKSALYRVHPTLYMGTPQMEERCKSVEADPKEWILNY